LELVLLHGQLGEEDRKARHMLGHSLVERAALDCVVSEQHSLSEVVANEVQGDNLRNVPLQRSEDINLSSVDAWHLSGAGRKADEHGRLGDEDLGLLVLRGNEKAGDGNAGATVGLHWEADHDVIKQLDLRNQSWVSGAVRRVQQTLTATCPVEVLRRRRSEVVAIQSTSGRRICRKGLAGE
jgi:hypothetical protein